MKRRYAICCNAAMFAMPATAAYRAGMNIQRDNATLVWDLGCQLGEGPLWVPEERALWFVDIERAALHRFLPESGEKTTWHAEGRPSFIVKSQGGGFIVGKERALVHFDGIDFGETLAAIPMREGNRTNDATVGPDGRLWFGTMDDDKREPHGRVYTFDGALRERGGNCTITNGPAISPDGATLYHVDTVARRIWKHAIHDPAADLDAGTLFIEFAREDGNPDGVTTDAEGCVWVAMWGGWCVRRYAPAGELLAKIDLPCAQVTKVAFGGQDLRTAYVTTARTGLSETDLINQPLAGGVFTFNAPAPGLAPYAVRA